MFSEYNQATKETSNFPYARFRWNESKPEGRTAMSYDTAKTYNDAYAWFNQGKWWTADKTLTWHEENGGVPNGEN